ncbi:MAG: hypothetical protein JO128_16260 [Alphaproteobacteria bacterium]|nr:hypothetical protein [Alphaproteobacteria bacterium]
MTSGQRKRSGPPAGSDTPVPPAHPAAPRRHLLSPANDNALAPVQRILRAVLFVALGAALAWALRMMLG